MLRWSQRDINVSFLGTFFWNSTFSPSKQDIIQSWHTEDSFIMNFSIQKKLEKFD